MTSWTKESNTILKMGMALYAGMMVLATISFVGYMFF